jgi:heptosyltransferase-3
MKRHTQAVLQRYNGRDLGAAPHIAVLGSCKVGNFVVTLPLLWALRHHHPAVTIDFWGNEATRDFEDAMCQQALLNWRSSWDLAAPQQFQTLAAAERATAAGPPDLLINCDGFNPLTKVLASCLRPARAALGGPAVRGATGTHPLHHHPRCQVLAV